MNAAETGNYEIIKYIDQNTNFDFTEDVLHMLMGYCGTPESETFKTLSMIANERNIQLLKY